MIQVFDSLKVWAYLDNEVAKLNEKPHTYAHAWRWVGLRKSDVVEVSPYSNALVGVLPYSKPIPFPVLLTAEKLIDKFGTRVCLEVSDIYTVPKADPFLSVRATGSPKRFIIERWDEPGFRG
jgi:hypothetical protein